MSTSISRSAECGLKQIPGEWRKCALFLLSLNPVGDVTMLKVLGPTLSSTLAGNHNFLSLFQTLISSSDLGDLSGLFLRS